VLGLLGDLQDSVRVVIVSLGQCCDYTGIVSESLDLRRVKIVVNSLETVI